ncbi:MAG: T9SS type A sorting domain-containing protein [Puia sp.]|nr:T9SS type A sorting domain-containing protein [Puia sp.]
MKAGPYIVPLLVFLACGYLRAPGQSVSGVVNSYFSITAVNTTTNSLMLDNASGLVSGQRVLIIQTKDATVSSSNDATFGNITAIGSAGNYEFNTICTVIGNEVWLKGGLVNAYDPAGQLQMVTVPVYTSVTVSSAVSALPWDPSTGKGGIVVMEAADTIYLDADIDVSGQGFLGGALVNYPIPPYDCSWAVPVSNYYLPLPASGDYTGGKKGEGIAAYILNEEYGRGKLANGGGGGNNNNTGGAGGGHYGAGGAGGQRAGESAFDCHGAYPGIGGLSLASYGYTPALNKIFFGGGGGSGHENNGVGLPGGNGGGIILLTARVVAGGGGSLVANGLSPVNAGNTDPAQAEGDGGGGGGAGGAVVINASIVTGFLTAAANGARGSNASNLVNDCTGPGGGGGGGVVWAAGAVFPAAVNSSVNGGGNGVVSLGSSKTSCAGLSNGALPGGAGISQTGYSAPLPGGDICSLLASPVLQNFTGSLTGQGNLLSWNLYPSSAAASEILFFTVERSVDRTAFTPLATLPLMEDTTAYRYADPFTATGMVYYRLVVNDKSGSLTYSPVIALNRQGDIPFGFTGLHPNPAGDWLSVDLSAGKGGTAIARVCDVYGGQVGLFSFPLYPGPNTFRLPVQGLAAGVYFLMVAVDGRKQVRSFIKQ